MWTEYQRHSVRTRKKKPLCGPSTNGIDNHTIPGVRPEFFTDGIVFSLLRRRVFHRRLSIENHFDPLYIRVGTNYPIS